MKTSFSCLVAICAFVVAGISSASAKPGWSEDFEKSAAQAKAEKKLLLIDFTGSDWCVWCKTLDKEVFSQPEFSDYAKKNLVLVEFDYASNGEPKSKEFGKLHGKMLQDSKVEGFPTVFVLNSEGKKIGELPYMEGGPKAFIAAIEKLKEK